MILASLSSGFKFLAASPFIDSLVVVVFLFFLLGFFFFLGGGGLSHPLSQFQGYCYCAAGLNSTTSSHSPGPFPVTALRSEAHRGNVRLVAGYHSKETPNCCLGTSVVIYPTGPTTPPPPQLRMMLMKL